VVTAPFELACLPSTPLPVPHGSVSTNGYLFARGGRRLLAYLSDCQSVPTEVAETMKGVDVLIIDGLRDQPHPTHLNVGGAIEVARQVGARRAYLTHQTHDKKHADRERDLPPGVGVVYDGMKLELD
jgi:phosphoribosyl 1,2-cyclic phosphate phosphodiesterase